MIIAGLNESEVLQDSITEAELLLQITSLSIKKNEDPGNLTHQISGIQNRYQEIGANMDAKIVQTKVVQILSAPEIGYSVLISNYKLLLTMQSQEDQYTWQNVITHCKENWRQTNSGKMCNAKNDDGEEVVLNNMEFKGKYNHCGEVGHKKAQ